MQHRASQCQDPGSRKDVLLLHSAWDNFSIKFISHLKWSTVLEQVNWFRFQMKWFGVNLGASTHDALATDPHFQQRKMD